MPIVKSLKNICSYCKLPLLLHGNGQVHMTEGPIVQQLLCFMIPIMVSQILQQFYTIADTAMVGNFLGATALAALGTTTILCNVIVNFYIGLSTGVSVIFSRLFGGYSYKELNTCIQTVFFSCLFFGITITIAGLLGVDEILLLLSTPKDILPIAAQYLSISFLGLTAQLFYNIGNSTLQALGNTTAAFHYLLIASVLNLVLDYSFIVIFPFGVIGAALATVIAQWLAAIFVIRKIIYLEGDWHFEFVKPLVNLYYLKELSIKGIPAGLQAIFMSISSLVIQTYINSFGYAAMAGMVVYARVEGFMYLPLFAFGLALTSFIGQNVGAGHYDRVSEGMRISMKFAVLGTIGIATFLLLLAPGILKVFTDDEAIISNGLEAVYYTFPFYWCYGINQVYIGGIRGLGNTVYPMLTSLAAYSVFRVLWCYSIDGFIHDMRVVYSAYNISFFVMAFMLYWGYKYYLKKNSASADISMLQV